TQIVDPVYRKGDSVMTNITKGIPGLSTGVSPYEDPLGNPSQRQFPLLNAVSPLSVTEEKPEYRALYEARQQNLEQNAITRAIKEGKDVSPEAIERSLQGSTATGNTQLDEKIQKYELNAAVERIRISEEPEWIGDTFVYKDGDSVKKI